jgi:hypothetical protein
MVASAYPLANASAPFSPRFEMLSRMGFRRTLGRILDPNGSEAVVKRPGVRGQTGKANFRRTFILGLAWPWSVCFAGILRFATLRPCSALGLYSWIVSSFDTQIDVRLAIGNVRKFFGSDTENLTMERFTDRDHVCNVRSFHRILKTAVLHAPCPAKGIR